MSRKCSSIKYKLIPINSKGVQTRLWPFFFLSSNGSFFFIYLIIQEKNTYANSVIHDKYLHWANIHIWSTQLLFDLFFFSIYYSFCYSIGNLSKHIISLRMTWKKKWGLYNLHGLVVVVICIRSQFDQIICLITSLTLLYERTVGSIKLVTINERNIRDKYACDEIKTKHKIEC